MTIFISYSRKDTEFVKKLAGDLKSASYDVWWDQDGIQAGEDWVRKIPDAIYSSNYFIVILTSDSIGSEWVEKEITQALKFGRRIIPILRDQSDVPFTLINLNPIDFQNDNKYKDNFRKLLAALKDSGEPIAVPSSKRKPSVPASPRKYIFSGVALILIIILALVLIFRPDQLPAPAPTSTLASTPVPTGISGSVPSQIIITYGDGGKASYGCPTSSLPETLSHEEKIRLEYWAEMPAESLDKLEWWSFVSGSKEKFGLGKTASYSPAGEGIIYVTLDDANICTLNIQ